MNLKNKDEQYIKDLNHYLETTNTSSFNKKIHLKILKNDIAITKNKFIYIWFLTATTGEEIYSIIIELLEHGIQNFLIIASNINNSALIHLKKGIHNIDKLKYIPFNLIKKYFLSDYMNSGIFTAKDLLKKYFIIKKINLIDNPKFKKKINYIFCKDILFYFNKSTQIKIINNLLSNLDDYGYLFMGHSESLLNLTNKVETIFKSVYSKKK